VEVLPFELIAWCMISGMEGPFKLCSKAILARRMDLNYVEEDIIATGIMIICTA
jgi:hypothetical protein